MKNAIVDVQRGAISALIAEDEPALATFLATTLKELWPELVILPPAPNGIAAVTSALAHQPDILFLDIKMPGQTGLEAVQDLAARWMDSRPFPLTVFVTAYDSYAVQAFDQAAFDYVLKPIDHARLSRTVDRLKARLALVDKEMALALATEETLVRSVEQLGALLSRSPLRKMRYLTVVRAASGHLVLFIPVEKVLYFQALDKYVDVVTVESGGLLRMTLRELSAQLDPAQFAQIGRGCIVNLDHVAAASRDSSGKLTLHLRGWAEPLSVSRLFAHLFRQM